MSLVTIGEFTVDVEERRIYNQQGECLVEPKVIDVLCYLIMHADRFVSQKELHAEVWTGRIVPDTTVRRTISKLRAVLGDSDTENPRHIKSQMKPTIPTNASGWRGLLLAALHDRPDSTYSSRRIASSTGESSHLATRGCDYLRPPS